MIYKNLSYLLPLLVPIYYKLPIEYYTAFCFLCISKYALKEKNSYLNQLFEFNSFIFLYSLYCFRNVFISYSITSLSILDFNWSGGIFMRFSIFILSFLLNYKKNPLLFYPFIYKLFIKPFLFSEKKSLYSEIFQSNLVDLCFFFLCSPP